MVVVVFAIVCMALFFIIGLAKFVIHILP